MEDNRVQLAADHIREEIQLLEAEGHMENHIHANIIYEDGINVKVTVGRNVTKEA